MPKIFISPSNQTNNLYCGGKVNEAENCKIIASYLEKALLRCGFEVKVAKHNDNAATRCKKSNSWGADLHLPVHTNAFHDEVVNGVEVFVYNNLPKETKDILKPLGSEICKAIAEASPGGNNRGVKVDDFQELRDTPKAVYIEVDFHTNIAAASWLTTEQKKIAEIICKCLCEHFNKAYIKEGESMFNKGDIVLFKGNTHYSSANDNTGYKASQGKAEITAISKGAKHPYHLIAVKGGNSTVYGWVNADDITSNAGEDLKENKYYEELGRLCEQAMNDIDNLSSVQKLYKMLGE